MLLSRLGSEIYKFSIFRSRGSGPAPIVSNLIPAGTTGSDQAATEARGEERVCDDEGGEQIQQLGAGAAEK